ncbi:MAG: TetR/AcrR family transcriptional regulator [Chloroflexota bacterium]
MGRKSLKVERKAQILDAFERCIVQYGLDGTSLKQVADEANVKRSIIRHYIGNRDDLVDALIERIVRNYQKQLLELDASAEDMPAKHYLPQVLDYLFRVERTSRPQNKIIIDVLMVAQDRYPKAKGLLRELFKSITDSIAKDLIDAYPNASEKQCQQVAYSIWCLSMSNGSMMWLGMDIVYNQSARASAEALLKTLE